MKDAIPSADSSAIHDALPRGLLDLIGSIHTAKLGAATMYTGLAPRMPTVEATLAVRHLAADEVELAAELQRLTHGPEPAPSLSAAVAPGCGLYDQHWPSALMAAFALDQAATAALLGIARLGQGSIADVAARITDEERSHQSFAIAAFKSVADSDPAAGRRLAAEMLVARDWVKQVFPRHAILADLAACGVLPSDAARVHDSFLASLGDRVQEALGVLGD